MLNRHSNQKYNSADFILLGRWPRPARFNHLAELMRLLPNAKWSTMFLPSNVNFTPDLFKYITPDYPLKWILPYNPHVTWDMIYNDLSSGYYHPSLSECKCVTWDIVQNYPDIRWDYRNLSSNINITWDIVKNNSHLDWDYNILSANPNITWDIVKNNSHINWSYSWMSSNPNITWDIVKNNKHIDWDYKAMSSNPNITWDIIKENLHLNWDFEYLTFYENDIVTYKIMKDYPLINWNMDLVYRKADYPLNDINNIDPKHYRFLSLNPNLTWDIIYNNPQINWNFECLSMNNYANYPKWQYNGSTYLKYPDWIRAEIRFATILLHNRLNRDVIYEILCWIADYK